MWVEILSKPDATLLATLPPFRKLDSAQIGEILDLATSGVVEAGRPVFEEGMEADRFYLLLDGHIRVLRITPDGDQVIALHIASGQLFGIAVALGHTQYPATAMAADACLSLSWPNRHWQDFVTQYEGFATETYKVVGQRIGEINDQMVAMATQQVEQRIARALLRLINQTGRKVEAGIEIDFPITRQDIAEMTGTTLHTVSRLLSAWERDGLVASARRKITVTEPHRLVLLSGVEA